MKALTFVWAFIAFACPEPLLLANDDLVKLHYNGQDLKAKHLVKGHLNLYVSYQFAEKKVTGPQYRKGKTRFVKRYFLKVEHHVEMISPYNYKKVLKKHMPNAPELHRSLGRIGFRYENIPSITRFYNEFRLEGTEPLEHLQIR